MTVVTSAAWAFISRGGMVTQPATHLPTTYLPWRLQYPYPYRPIRPCPPPFISVTNTADYTQPPHHFTAATSSYSSKQITSTELPVLQPKWSNQYNHSLLSSIIAAAPTPAPTAAFKCRELVQQSRQVGHVKQEEAPKHRQHDLWCVVHSTVDCLLVIPPTGGERLAAASHRLSLRRQTKHTDTRALAATTKPSRSKPPGQQTHTPAARRLSPSRGGIWAAKTPPQPLCRGCSRSWFVVGARRVRRGGGCGVMDALVGQQTKGGSR